MMTRSGDDFAQSDLGFVAALDAVDDKTFGLEIIGEQQAQGGLILDDEDARRGRCGDGARAVGAGFMDV